VSALSVSIDARACVGCGACVRACPGNLIALGPDGHARMRRPRDCWGCTACLKACPAGAIAYFLGADAGGRGTTLRVSRSGALSVWEFRRPDGSVERVEVDARDANAY
jgi:adenylylsulfate reductase subunit B